MEPNFTYYYEADTIEDSYPYSIQVPEIITKTCREITRNSTLLIRLLRLILDEGPPPKDYENLIKRTTNKLNNQYGIWDAHYKADQDEYHILNNELEDALLMRSSLQAKSKLGDINEMEYVLNLSIVDWSINELKTKCSILKDNLEAMNNLRVLLDSEDVNFLYHLSKNNFVLLKSLTIKPDTMGMLLQCLSEMLNTIKNKSKLTI